MNQVVLIGNLVRDPELRYTNSGKAVANFTLAINRGFGKDNEADFIPVVVWEKQAENCANYLAKGRKVAVHGSIRTSSYEAQNGEKRYKTEIQARTVEFLGSGGGGDENYPSSKPAPKTQQNQSNNSNNSNSSFNPDDINLEEFQAMDDDDDLPF